MLAQRSDNPRQDRASRRARQFPRAEVSVQEAAEIKGVAEITIRRRIADGSLPAHRIGSKLIRIKLADLEALGRPVA